MRCGDAMRRRRIMVEFPGDEWRMANGEFPGDEWRMAIEVGWEESWAAPRTLQQVREVLKLRGNLGEEPCDIVGPEDDNLLNGPSTLRPL